MIRQAYLRYKLYLNTLSAELFGDYRLNNVGVFSVTMSTILMLIASWMVVINGLLCFIREWRAGYIIL